MSVDRNTPAIHVLILLEGDTLTGPAKNVLEFCRVSQTLPGAAPVSVSLATFVRTRKAEGTEAANDLLKAAAAQGLGVHTLSERSAFDLRVLRRLQALARQTAPDIVETHSVKSHFLMRWSGLWRAHPWIAFHHGYTNEGAKMRVYNQLDRWSLRVPAKVVTVCAPFKKELASRGAPRDRIEVLHNGIAADWLGSPQDHSLLDEMGVQARGERVVLAIGRLSGEKAFPDLVAAIDRLRHLRPELAVRLVILGEGAERTRIEQTARRLGVQDRVTLLGHVSDVRPYYRIADLLAISSVSEGSPNALLEGMAAGVPVVATSVGGIPEMVSNHDAVLLVPPRDPERMAAAMARVLSDTGLAQRLVANARQLIATHYSPERRVHWLLDLYATVSRRRTGNRVEETALEAATPASAGKTKRE